MNIDVMRVSPHWYMTIDVSPSIAICKISIPSMQFLGSGDNVDDAVAMALEKARKYFFDLETKRYDI